MQSLRAANYFKRVDISRIPHAPVLLGAAFALLVLTVLISMALLDHTQRERDRLVQTIDTQNQLDDLLAAMRRMESGQRGYLLAGDPQFLTLYNETRAHVLDRVSRQSKRRSTVTPLNKRVYGASGRLFRAS